MNRLLQIKQLTAMRFLREEISLINFFHIFANKLNVF